MWARQDPLLSTGRGVPAGVTPYIFSYYSPNHFLLRLYDLSHHGAILVTGSRAWPKVDQIKDTPCLFLLESFFPREALPGETRFLEMQVSLLLSLSLGGGQGTKMGLILSAGLPSYHLCHEGHRIIQCPRPSFVPFQVITAVQFSRKG